MKISLFTLALFGALYSAMPSAQASRMYSLTITNSSSMPISPGIIYSSLQAAPTSEVGTLASDGFTELCQTGSVAKRASELKSERKVIKIWQTTGPIMPGASQVVTINVKNPRRENIHFESMYGKTKDVCATASINSHSLVALSQMVTNEVVVTDHAVVTGRFTSPSLPVGQTSPGDFECDENLSSPESCLRNLSKPLYPMQYIGTFNGYLPSLINALEMQYGAEKTQQLLIPSSGAVQIKIKIKD